MNQDKVGATILSARTTHGKRPLQSSHTPSFHEGMQQYPFSAENTFGRTYHASPSEYSNLSTPQSTPHTYDNPELHKTYPSTYYGAVNYTTSSSTSQQAYSPVGPSNPTTYGPANYRASPQVSQRLETTGAYSYYSPLACSYPSQQTPPAAEIPQTSRDRWHSRPQKPSMLEAHPSPQYTSMPQTIAISDSPGSPQRPFCCDLCTLSFNRQHDLKRHRETHSGEKPFLCNGGCGKTFTRKDALKRHQVSIICSDGDGWVLTRYRS